MGTLSFIHCSDLHLGCQQYNELQRWLDFGRAFGEIVSYAIQHKVNYFFIGGDLFHHRSINAQTLEQAIVELKRLKDAGIKVIAIEGNHDKAFYLEGQSWMNFLNSQGYLHLLKPEFIEGKLILNPYDGVKGCVYQADGIKIYGLGYLGATTKQRLEEIAEWLEPSEDFTVVLLHAAVDKLMGQDMAGVNSKVFEKFNGVVDYFALGHIHSRQESDPCIFNPGAPESVHIDEAKNDRQKGFYHVIVHGKEKTVNFVESKRRDIYYVSIDLTGINNPEDAADKIIQEMDTLELPVREEKPMVQIILYGEVDFHSYAIDVQGISEVIKLKYHCLIVDIVNNVNLHEAVEQNSYSGFDRVSIERNVIRKMICQERPEFKNMEDKIVDLILKIKNQAMDNVGPEEIVATIEEDMGSMLLSLTEAAVTEEKV